MKVGFIGAGNMGGAILRGYAPTAKKQNNEITVYVPSADKRKKIALECNVSESDSIASLVQKCDTVIVGVKPNTFPEVMPQIAEAFSNEKLLISMAAGITIDYIQKYLGENAKIIRIMPNTPAQVGEAMIAACRNKNVDDKLFDQAFEIFKAIGKAEEVSEELIHCVIGVSGSSPAYTFMYIESLIDAAVKNGLSPEKAKVFAAQSVLGAAKMVLETDVTPEQLRINVCSPGGTTIEAVNSLFDNDFPKIVSDAFQAAVDKSVKMSENQ